MESAGVRLLYPLVNLAVMWFGRVLANLPKFISLAFEAERYFRKARPDAVVLIDYPGFNWALAKRAKRLGLTVIYYVPPQLWAWAGWRVKKVRKYVDYVLCSLPFEEDWYRQRGVKQAVYVGHPYFDELSDRALDLDFLAEQQVHDGAVVTILPGSRTQEIKKNFPLMLRAAAVVAGERKDTRFVVACLHDRHRELVQELIRGSGIFVDTLQVHAARTAELIRLADVAWAVSGSVGLELMAEGLPTVVVYKIKPFELLIARPFIKARYISLVNLLADEEVMPEYLTVRDVSAELAAWAIRLLGMPAERDRASKALGELRERVAKPGASLRAADLIAQIVRPVDEGPRSAQDPGHWLRRPHFASSPASKEEPHGDGRGVTRAAVACDTQSARRSPASST
jgi:lipid-A-disaccharide synthase